MPKASKFETLDTLVVQRVARCPCTFTELQESEIVAEAEPLALVDRLGVMAPAWRVLDRRLQALRKKGRIESVKRKWCIAGTRRLL
jgi:hypothetical protein